MTSQQNNQATPVDDRLAVTVENIGGIDSCEFQLSPGLTAFEGRNATNRTSLLTAIAGGLGGTSARLKSDADHGKVELELNGESYTREYTAESGAQRTQGTPYTTDAESIDTFVALLWDNPIRQAVRSNDDLRELLMRPVDTQKIQRQIRDRKREREQLTERRRGLEQRREQLPSLQQQRETKAEELEQVETELQEVREHVKSVDIDRTKASETQSLLDTLKKKRQEKRNLQEQIEHHTERIEDIQDSIADLEAKLADFEVPTDEIERLNAEIENFEQQERTLSNQIDDLLTIVSFNDDLLDGDPDELLGVEPETETVTDQLTADTDQLVCWTCGTEVSLDQVESRLEGLRDIVQERRQRREELRSEIDEREDSLEEYERQVRNQREIESQLSDLRDEVEHRKEERDRLQSDLDALTEEISSLENEAAQLEDERADELVEAYEKISDLEYERGQLQERLSDLDSQIEDLEDAKTEIQQLKSQIEELSDDLDSLRGRIENLETDVVEQFNTHIEDLIEKLEYRNIERVWLEQKVDPDDRSGGSFDLHIVRQAEDGGVYEDSLETLSESERELVGLVLALTGNLVHGVSEKVLVMLLDSVESLDSERLATVLQYFSSRVNYMLVALPPEYAAALPGADVISADSI